MVLERLRQKRDGFSNEIPSEILRGPSNFKVSRNWWQSVVTILEVLGKKDQIPQRCRREVDVFISHYTSREFHEQPRTTAQDIERVNSLLDRILGRS